MNDHRDRIHSPCANLPMVRSWLELTGCERIFEVDKALPPH